MKWNNIDLNSHEIGAEILDGLTFEILLLEISCNVKDINEVTVRKQFEDDLKSKIECAKEIFEANLKNIVKHAINERNK